MKKIKKKWKRFQNKPNKYFADFQFYSKKTVNDFYNIFQDNHINKQINVLKDRNKENIKSYIEELLELKKQYPKSLLLKLELGKSYERDSNIKETIYYLELYLEQNPYNLKVFIDYISHISSMSNYKCLTRHLHKQLLLKKKDLDYISKIGINLSKYINVSLLLEEILPSLDLSNKHINIALAVLYSVSMNISLSIPYWQRVGINKFKRLKNDLLNAYEIKHIESLFGNEDKKRFNPKDKDILLIIEKNTDIIYLLEKHRNAKKVIVVFMSNISYKNIEKPDEILKNYPNVHFVSDLINFNFDSFEEYEYCVSLAENFSKIYVKTLFEKLPQYVISEQVTICEEHIALDLEDRFYNFLFPIIGLRKIIKKYKYDDILIAFDTMAFNFIHLIFKEMQIDENIDIWFNVTTAKIKDLENSKSLLRKSLSSDFTVEKIDYQHQLHNLFSDSSCNLYVEHKNMKNYLHLVVNYLNPEKNYLYLPTGLALFKKFNSKMDVLVSQSSWVNNRQMTKSINNIHFLNIESDDFSSELYLPGYSQYNKEIKKYQEELTQLSLEVFKSVKIDEDFEEVELFLMLSGIVHTFLCRNIPYTIKYINDINKLYTLNPPRLIFTTIERSFLSRITISLAKYHGIKTFGHHPGLISAFPRYKKPLVDYHFVMGKEEQRIFYKYFKYDKSKLIIAGSALIDEKRKIFMNTDRHKYKESIGFKKVEKIVLFTTQHGQGEHQFAIIDLVLNSLVSLENVGLIIKTHPLEPSYNLTEYNKMIKNHNLQTKCKVVNDNITYELVKISDLVVALFSAVGMEAAMFGKQVLVINLKSEPYPIELDKLGVALGAKEPQDISSLIYKMLYIDSVKKDLKEKQKQYFGNDLGRQNFVDIVETYIEKLL